MSTWDEWKARWSSKWSDLQAAAVQRYQQDVQDRWSDYSGRVEGTIQNLNAVEALLADLPTRIAEYERLGGQYGQAFRDNLDAISVEYHNMAAGVFAGATKTVPDTRGGPPTPTLGYVQFVVGAIALTLIAVCFAVACYPASKSLLEQAQAQHDEVNGRIEAMRTGTSLQPSTLPPKEDGVSLVVLGGIALVGGAALFYALRSKQQ